HHMINLIEKIHTDKTNQLNTLKKAYVFQKPTFLFKNKQIYLDQLQNQLHETAKRVFIKQKDTFNNIHYKLLQHSPERRINEERSKISRVAKQLENNYLR